MAVSETPYDVDPNRQKNGYVFSDISYAISMNRDVCQKDLVLVKLLPTIRLYKDAVHYLEGQKIEVKPLEIAHWSSMEVYRCSVRYLTLTGMIMLHEYLKLCYMSTEDPDFFPEPEHLSVHLIAAVGYTAWQYIHRIRDGEAGEPIKYVSSYIDEFNLRKPDERNRFRDRLNEIHTLHVTIIKEAMQKTIREVLALEPTEIRRRLKSRTHKGVQFFRSVRNGIGGFGVESSAPTAGVKSPSKPRSLFSNIPEEPKAKPEQSNRNSENLHLPSPLSSPSPSPSPSSSHSPSNTRSPTCNIIMAQGSKGNKDSAFATFTSHAPTVQTLTKDKKPRCQARNRSLQQCSNAAHPGQPSCHMLSHKQTVKDQLYDTLERLHSVPLSPPSWPRDSQQPLKSKIPTTTPNSTRKARSILRPNGYGGM
ncbi:MAG: hypothetical protein Q9175_008220 [Cornicularia normoerica]